MLETKAPIHASLLPVGGRRLLPLMFTTAIITGVIGDKVNVADRWCYHTCASAEAALAGWDGIGEPIGWHRHPATGRRVIEDDVEALLSGGKIGELYINH